MAIRTTISGQTWLTGTTAPAPDVGYKSQFYLNTLTGEVYEKTEAYVWTLRGDLTPNELSDLTILPSGTGSGDTGSIKFKELAANGTSAVALKAPDSIPATYEFTFPSTPGTAGYALTTDGTGKMSWSSGASLAPVTSVNTKQGDVVLKTVDIDEEVNLYFTDGRAKSAAVVNSMADGLTDQAPSVHSAKEYIDTAVSGEAAARATAVSAEASSRTLADNTLQTNIDTEANTRAVEDTNLGLRIDQEITDRTNADSALQTNLTNALTAETTNRINADNNLQTNIEAEATSRATADTALGLRIDQEITERVAADAGLKANIDAEEAARISADGVLQANINTEESARIAADGVLQNNIDAEATARAGADTTLQGNIDTESAARIAAVTAEETARLAADAVLQTNIDNEANTRAVADTNLHDEIVGEIAARQAADALLIPLTQKGAAEGVATLDAGGVIPVGQIPDAAIPVKKVNDLTGEVVLTTKEISEDPTSNLYFTDARAKTATVVDLMTGGETDKAPSVSSAKEYIDNGLAAEKTERQNADTTLQTNIDAEATARTQADNLLQDNITAEAAARTAADALLIPLDQKGQPNGVANLDGTGKIPSAQLPALAITSVTVVATIEERDALTAGEGDFCVVTDLSKTYIYNGIEWIEMQFSSPVTSVNNKTGSVYLTTKEISEGTNLYFTDERAKTASVINITSGSETDQAASIQAMKTYVAGEVSTEATARTQADTTLQNSIDSEATARQGADTLLQTNIDAESAARQAADALLIPLSQKGAADGVATLDATGLIPTSQIPPGAVPVQSVNEKTGAVELKTKDIAEDTNLYFTDARAKTAAVLNDITGSEIDQAPSVSAVKTFITEQIAAEAALRTLADTTLQNNIDAETAARQAADALLIPLSQKGAPLGVATLDASGKIDANLVPGATSEIGTPTRGTYDGGLLAFTPTTLIADAADQTNLILSKLAPAKPPNLSTKTISLTSSYSAKEAGTNTLRSNVTDVLKPQTSTITQFYDGDSGTLTAEIDAVDAGHIALTTASEAGTYGALVVTADVDYYAGQSGKEGFWRALSGYIVSATNLSYGAHSYQMKHSMTGNTNLLNFYVDNPGSPTISGDTFDLSAVSTSYISGVPSLGAGSQIKFDFTVNGAVGKFFNSSRVADVSGSNVSTANISPAAGGYAEDAAITVTAATVSVNSGSYSESPTVSIRGYNSKSIGGSSKSVSLGSRIDTASNESARKVSGSGQYPATGYGGSFNSAESLKTTYSEELQMLGGYYQRPPAVNYSTNVPTAGPDYSTGMGTSDRWVTFVHGSSLSSASAFTLTINGASGSWSGTATPGVKIYAKVEGVTGWIDCNASYPGVGSPSNNGDPAMVFGSSSATSKRVTFGSTSRSGTLYIRIGLPSGSDKKFTSITVGSIV